MTASPKGSSLAKCTNLSTLFRLFSARPVLTRLVLGLPSGGMITSTIFSLAALISLTSAIIYQSITEPRPWGQTFGGIDISLSPFHPLFCIHNFQNAAWVGKSL